MLDLLSGFVHELRAAGLPVSMTENLDAMRALEFVPLGDRAAFKTALSATLVKHADHAKVFNILFDVYFALQPFDLDDDEDGRNGAPGGGVPVPGSMPGGGAGGLRAKLPEDVEFMHASRDEMAALQRAIGPLARALAARLAMRRRRHHRGQLDFRATVRRSLSYGGVPAEPRFRRPHPSKPEIMVIADISGSVASFARFTLQLVHALASQFSRVRSFVFIDGIDEVTRFFEAPGDLADAVRRINTEADVVWVDGHSDYGHAFEVFHGRFGGEVTPKR